MAQPGDQVTNSADPSLGPSSRDIQMLGLTLKIGDAILLTVLNAWDSGVPSGLLGLLSCPTIGKICHTLEWSLSLQGLASLGQPVIL